MDTNNKRTIAVILKLLWLFLKFSIAALVIVLPIRWFVAQPFIVSGASMEPTFQDNDYLVIDKLSYDFHTPQRGDVIIMRYPLDPSIYFVKRIIGLPGETVAIASTTIKIISSTGTSTLAEPYLVMPLGKPEYSTTTLSSNEYFVLGDNRGGSSDSREWGPLDKRYIIGRAFTRLLPLDKIQILPGQFRYSNQ